MPLTQPLTVLSIAYTFAPVGPQAVGGAEQILTDLDHALTHAGHTSLVVACQGSEAAGTLYPTPLPPGLLDDLTRTAHIPKVQAAIDAALQSNPVDLLHLHGIDFHHLQLPSNLPVLVTLHMPPSWYPRHIWSTYGPNVHFQCVSETQRKSCPTSHQHIPVIENGVALPPLDPNFPPEDFALALGRICPEKNLHTALEAGTLANTPVLLGGQVFPYATHLDYFHQHLQPLLAPPSPHRYLGPLHPTHKHSLLQRARCLLLPTLAPETSSLVAMEALAAGTPVIAYPSGALPEILDPGTTGLFVTTAAEMADAIHQVSRLDRKACRRSAERRFSLTRMTVQYLHLYQHLVSNHLRPSPPETPPAHRERTPERIPQ